MSEYKMEQAEREAQWQRDAEDIGRWEREEEEIERAKSYWRMMEREQHEAHKRVRMMQELNGLGFRDNCFTIWTNPEELG